MNCLLVMKIKWSLDINTGAVERSEAARARRLAGATVVGPVTALADQLWHAETGPPDQIWRWTNYCVTGTAINFSAKNTGATLPLFHPNIMLTCYGNIVNRRGTEVDNFLILFIYFFACRLRAYTR